ncbi:MAG: hypothetical protein QOG21_1802 [Actinomycetota bacterium]|jgi:hypothetical protein|nr:hypothetical protein [Actinomycetota bacterium]
MTDPTPVETDLEDHVVTGYRDASIAPAITSRRLMSVWSCSRPRLPIQVSHKGRARYWQMRAGGKSLDDLAWSYQESISECAKIENLVCFFYERVDTYVDGTKIEVPRTPWSR